MAYKGPSGTSSPLVPVASKRIASLVKSSAVLTGVRNQVNGLRRL
jgi:hypothetical protein